jgi:hypothetical protein
LARLRKFLTFSNVIAMVALFFALGGSVYAAAGKISGTQIKPKSIPGNRLKAKAVGTSQIQNGAVGGPQIKANAISGKQIQSGAITEKQIKAGSISGTQIKSGSLGATQINQTTLTGISAANIHMVQYVAASGGLVSESENGTTVTATCPSGMKVIGGGATTSSAHSAFINESGPTGERTGWYAVGFGISSASMTVTAICTPVATTTG